MITAYDADIAPLTSLRAGGKARILTTVEQDDDLPLSPLNDSATILGYGSNSLVSDHGLEHLVVLRNSKVTIDMQTHRLYAHAGAWWDDIVSATVERGLWGIELMSGIPSSVGGAVVGNIAAYGQAIQHSLRSIDVYDTASCETRTILADELAFDYRSSLLQAKPQLIVIGAEFQLSAEPTRQLDYEAALAIADELHLDHHDLDQRRRIIIETRRRAGSLWDYRHPEQSEATAGSFFRNPLVTSDQLDAIIAHDESGKTAETIKRMNAIHGGDSTRVSAAHVLLAAGYHRGQEFGNVRLHPHHVLKIENYHNASAQEIYDVAHEIMHRVQTTLSVTLQPEVRFIGRF